MVMGNYWAMSDIEINWEAAIVPYISLAGIPIGTPLHLLEESLARNVIDGKNNLYQFEGSPVLQLRENIEDSASRSLCFSIYDKSLTNWDLVFDSPENPSVETRALVVSIKENKVLIVAAWLVEFLDQTIGVYRSSYQGKLQHGVKLGDRVDAMLSITDLEYDPNEELFYPDKNYGGLIVGGAPGSLEDFPDQIILSMRVTPP
jgi:hypothetical protein